MDRIKTGDRVIIDEARGMVHTNPSFETEEDMDILGEMLLVAKNFAKEHDILDYRLIFNAGKYVVVPHLHLHLIVGNLPPNL